MRLFGKKDEQEIDEEEYVEEKLPSKRFRDLKPENRKKRVVPARPWGKKERLVVLFVFVGTIVLSGVLAASARSWKLPGLPKLTIPSFNLLKEETIIVSGSKPPFDSEKKAKRVIEAFSRESKNLSGVYSLYVVELDSGTSYGVGQDEVGEAASLIKLPIMSFVYRMYEDGEIDIDRKVSGSNSTYRQLVEAMGKRSDNSAQAVLVKEFGESKIQSYIEEIDMINTSYADNKTKPKDIGFFFEKLWNGRLVNKEGKDAILDSLTDTIYEDWLAKGIPPDIRVAHKYGREVHVVNDAGIVFSENPFIVVIMTDGIVETEADEFFPELSRVVYEKIIE